MLTKEEFLDRIDEIMCGTSNAERAYLADLYDEVIAPHWISVEDKLPPMHCHLQDLGESTYGRGKIFCGSEPVITHRVDGCIDMHCLMFNGEKNEFVWGGWNGSHSQPFDGSMITHWMMPAPPHHIIDTNKKVDRVVGTADHIKTALDVLNKKGGEKWVEARSYRKSDCFLVYINQIEDKNE